MIKINLIEEKKSIKIPLIAGIDIKEINWKFILLALLFTQTPEWFLIDFLQDRLTSITEEEKKLKKANKELRKYIKKNRTVKEKMELYNQRISEFQSREKDVEKIIKLKINPAPLLEFITHNLPENVWINELKIRDKSDFQLSGGANSLKPVNQFIETMNRTHFFNGNLQTKKIDTVTETIYGRQVRHESFELQGQVLNHARTAM